MLHAERVGKALVVAMRHPPANAFGQAFVEAWNDLLDSIDPAETAVLHIRSEQKLFSAGADLKMMRAFFAGERAGERLVAHVAGMQRVFNRIEAMPVVSVAEVGGSALGGGFELALACDLRIAGHGASFGLPESRLGLIPGAGGTQRLTRLCGGATARRIILGGDVADGRAAERLGLVHWSAPDDELAAFAAATVARIAALSAPALAASKRCIAAAEASIESGLLIEQLETLRLLETDDTRARIRAFLDR